MQISSPVAAGPPACGASGLMASPVYTHDGHPAAPLRTDTLPAKWAVGPVLPVRRKPTCDQPGERSAIPRGDRTRLLGS